MSEEGRSNVGSLKPPSTVDQMFLDRTKQALAAAGTSALELLAASPGASTIELAKRLNQGASAIGLMMAVYEEALRNGVVRHAAKDLLVRTIRREFPEGWSSGGNVGAGVKLGSWRYEIKKYVRDAKMGDYASRIIRQLTIDNPPPEGWMAQSQNDSFIDDLFNLYWAVGPSEEKATA